MALRERVRKAERKVGLRRKAPPCVQFFIELGEGEPLPLCPKDGRSTEQEDKKCKTCERQRYVIVWRDV